MEAFCAGSTFSMHAIPLAFVRTVAHQVTRRAGASVIPFDPQRLRMTYFDGKRWISTKECLMVVFDPPTSK